MITVTLRVEGMTCGGCEQSVRRAVERVSGVTDATADHQAGVVSVRMVEGADIVAVRDAILDAGFTTGAMSGPRA
ncbi:MAG: copper chaperone [Chloroflexota bacterium]|jgi:copper chaperone CopZ|nr:copper chaperone [Chloroflexota bacterium]